MAKKVVLLRVGIDSGCGKIQSPLFSDGSFEFICIPDRDKVGKQTYGGKSLLKYFRASLREKMADAPIHLDPEFETFTYGDPRSLKSSLSGLQPGDFLVFYFGLQPWDAKTGWNREHRPALYLLGYFEVSIAGRAMDFKRQVLLREFAKNHHVRHPKLFKQQRNRLVLVKGGPGSRLFRRAHQISEQGADRAGRPLKVVSRKMRKIFGTFSGCGSIQRCVPRWVDPKFVDRSIGYLRELE
ncbi:MAG TPA: hypothetical protein VG056_06780 [Pirellulales bacterium]|jgi:hypothetical protein|nr:hypothetical protein [Pirellulales bacterium]